MIHLESDYNNGAHEVVLRHFFQTNAERTQSYGDDCFSQEARRLIREACDAPDAEIFFLAGGTQTNATILDCLLQPYEGVLCCDTAHINVHESGAVEFTGHKVLALPAREGKLAADDLRAWLEGYFADGTAEHMVRPGAVYITFPTELGTLYSAAELRDIRSVCTDYQLPLYVDGARLAYGLAASTDVTLPFLAQTVDVFYLGGTKCGALCGEAVVFPRGGAPAHMLSRIKQHGALLAKSRVVGVQFQALFSPAEGSSAADGVGEECAADGVGEECAADGVGEKCAADRVGEKCSADGVGEKCAVDGVGEECAAERAPLYLSIGRHAVDLAMRLRRLFVDHLGYRPFIDSPTNQQFFVIPNDDLEGLRRHIGFEPWCPVDATHTACRFVTSWATTEEEIASLEQLLS